MRPDAGDPLTAAPVAGVFVGVEGGEVVLSGPARHFVQFYEDETFLYEVVADFLKAGIQAREPAIVIATASHGAGFWRALEARDVDVDGETAGGLLTLLDAGATLSLFMRDGMPDRTLFRADVLPFLFQPMQGGSGGERLQRGSGLGLGLFISREIVVAHGGTIDVVSSEADGTRVTVTLPRG